MNENPPDRRVLLRVVNVSTELQTTRERGDAPPSSPLQTVQVTLIPLGDGYSVLGGQKLHLCISDPLHPLLASVSVDAVFELAPVRSS